MVYRVEVRGELEIYGVSLGIRFEVAVGDGVGPPGLKHVGAS